MFRVCRHHHVIEVRLDVGGPQHVEIPGEPPFRDEGAAEPADRHVCQGQQPVEPDSEAAAELGLVGTFERALCRWQHGPLRIEDQIEREAGIFAAVAQCVEPPQPFDARIEKTPRAALAIHILVQVARQRGDDADPAGREKPGEILLAGLQENGEVAPIDDLRAVIRRSLDQETGNSDSTPARRR